MTGKRGPTIRFGVWETAVIPVGKKQAVETSSTACFSLLTEHCQLLTAQLVADLAGVVLQLDVMTGAGGAAEGGRAEAEEGGQEAAPGAVADLLGGSGYFDRAG